MPERKYTSVSDALKNGVGALLSRLMTILGVPLILAMSSFIGYEVLGQIAKIAAQVESLSTKVEDQHDSTVRSLNRLDVRLTVVETKAQGH